jgi:cyclin-D1-binding protein 1
MLLATWCINSFKLTCIMAPNSIALTPFLPLFFWQKVITQSVILVASNMYEVLKEIIRFLTGLLRSRGNREESVDSLEKLLSCCREISDWVNDLGACAYPPQDASQMKGYVKNLFDGVGAVRKEIDIVAGGGSADGIYASLNKLEVCLHEINGLLNGVADEIGKLSIA